MQAIQWRAKKYNDTMQALFIFVTSTFLSIFMLVRLKLKKGGWLSEIVGIEGGGYKNSTAV